MPRQGRLWLAALLFALGCPSESGLSRAGADSGTLLLRIRDATGAPTPAMVSIRNADTGEPFVYGSNALLDRENETLTAPVSDVFSKTHAWRGEAPRDCDGLLRLPMPPGRYRLRVGKGIEYAPVEREFQVHTDVLTEVGVELQRFFDMPGSGWWSGDDHVHVTRSHPGMDPAIFLAARAADVHVVNALASGNVVATSFPQYAFGARGRARVDDTVIVPGQEEPRTHLLGHVIGLDLQGFVRHREDYLLYDRTLQEIREQGGLVGYGHWSYGSGRRGLVAPNQGAVLDLVDGLVDFVEVLDSDNRLRPAAYYDLLNLGFRLPATAGSDFPFSGSHIGDQRVYVHTGAGEPLSIDGWFRRLKAGHTFVSQGPLVDFRVDGAIPGSSLARSTADTVSVSVVVRGHPEIGSPRRVSLVQFGEPIREIASDDRQRSELSARWQVPVTASAWLAVHVEAHNGAVALTSPVYVTVGGAPTRDPRRFDALVSARLRNLERLEKRLRSAWLETRIEALEAAQPPPSPWRMEELSAWLADREEFLERLTTARGHWERLRDGGRAASPAAGRGP